MVVKPKKYLILQEFIKVAEQIYTQGHWRKEVFLKKQKAQENPRQ